MSAIAFITERYEARSSPVHVADARAKLLGAFGFIIAVTFTAEGAWLALALSAVPLVIVTFAAHLTPMFVVRRSFLALPFVAVALPLIFTRPGETLFTVPLTGWTGSREGIEAVATIMARSWIAVLAAVLLTATTPIVELLRGLRSLGVPRLLVATVSFTYRYFYVIGDEATRMMRARDSRSAALPGYRSGGSIRWRASVLGHMVGSLFVRSLERSERVYAAMQSRGFAGEPRFLDQPSLRPPEAVAAALLVGYAFAVQALAHGWLT
ncbi:MAG: cobalt ECF transporter T component CbiQ [Dehalococcoidia bacterium]|nr:cobalt ECF transporter T component CbiQ [Dehalococcoidia bacterium]